MSIFDTLVTDRTASDVADRTKKGHYNAEDLNRVTAAMEYIDAEFRKAGYESGYVRMKFDRPYVPDAERLPDGYVELEYIESTGVQYVDSEVVPDSSLKVNCEFQFSDTENTQLLFGSRDSDLTKRVSINIMNTGTLRYVWGANTADFKTQNLGERHTISTNGGIAVLDESDQVYIQQNPSEFFLPIYLFGSNDSGVFKYPAKVKLYSFSAELSGNAARKFVPCKNPSGSVGLYDLVTSEFFGNSGTGSFLAGPEVATEPTPPPLDPYTWYTSDEPTRYQMEQYLANVQKIRSVISVLESTPATPESVRMLYYVNANNIEKILLDVETLINSMMQIYPKSNQVICFSGNVFYMLEAKNA